MRSGSETIPRCARKRLVDPDGTVLNQFQSSIGGNDGTVNVRGQPIPNLNGKVVNRVLLLEGNASTTDRAVSADGTPHKGPVVKRRRQAGGTSVADQNMETEAASLEEDRRD